MARVLLVEDHEDVQFVVREFLEAAGHHVAFARPGRAALDDVRDVGYDLLITDIVMPFVTGWEVIDCARKHRDVPIIAISGGARAVSADAALRLSAAKGADGVLAKPFRREALLSLVAAILEPRRPAT